MKALKTGAAAVLCCPRSMYGKHQAVQRGLKNGRYRLRPLVEMGPSMAQARVVLCADIACQGHTL